ncbi:uncharacterized protein [Ptychodera flava]|uniref:uncharacterized protein n=1 Tax=Ptychodera flava TaxID=63121 RepID=UPI003969C0D5
MRNFSETFSRVPQSEHSSHHEGVASSSAGSEVSRIDVTRHGVSMSPLYQKLNNQTVIEQEAQDKFLKRQCLYRHHIIPDENSLYRAIAESFYGVQSRHNDLREKAVKFARENLFQSQHASEEDAELYAALDRSTEENILSHLLGVSIHVLVGGGDSRIEFHTLSPGNRDTERPIYISWLSIGHYDAVVSNTNHNEVYIKWLEQQISIFLQHGKVKEANTHVQSYHISLKGEQCTSDIKDTGTWEDRSKEQRHDEFIKLLFRTAQDLGKDELESLKFLCRNSRSMEILKGEIKDIHHARDLFQKLLDRKLMSADDRTLLVNLLQQISRVDLAENISPVKPYNVTESIKWLQKYLQEKYKRHYKDFKPIAWNTDVSLSLTEIYTRLKVIKINKGWRFKQGDTIENELEIFQNKDAELPCRRIAIEGAPAMGKSTFCRKLGYDWACGKLPQFQLLFFLEMRHISDNKKLSDIIFNQLLPEDSKITKKVLDNYIEQNQNLVLCLFDGLDEMTSISIEKSDIPAIISEKLLTWCTVVTTTRPYELRYSLTNCHAHFRIEGFTTEDAINFINKYFALMGNQQEAEKLISELNLENVKPPPLPFYPYKVNDGRLANYFTRSHRGDDNVKSLQSVDDTTGSHIRYDLLCNPLHLTFVCLLWEERKIIPTSNMTDIYTDILDCVLKRYCCKNDKTLANGKVPQDVHDEVNRLAHYAYDVCLKDNMMVDEDDLSETVLNLGLLVKDSGISRVKVQRHCFFYHKTWLEYFAALHICNNAHDFVNSIEAEVLNQKQVCLFVAGILKKKADPFLKQLVKKMQCKYNTLDYDITAEFRLICECLHEASIDIDYLAPEMPNHLILGKCVDEQFMYSTLQLNYKNITFGLLNCDTVFVFEQLSNMLCKSKGSATNIKHLYIIYGSDDRMLQLIRQIATVCLSLTTLGIQQVSIECMQLLAEALRKGWQLNTLTLSPAEIDTKVKEKANQAVIDLFKSVSCNKYLENFSWDAFPIMNIDKGNTQRVILCPLHELVEDGPNCVNVVSIDDLSYNINAVEIESFSDSLSKFTTKCKNTKKLTVMFYNCSSDIFYTIFNKLLQALKSASSVLASCGILWWKLFTTPDTTHNLVEALNTNSNISDFEACFVENSESNVVHFIRELKHIKSLTLHIQHPYDFKSLITKLN